MSSRRRERLNEHLKREISEILRRDVRDPRIGTPTVTGVDVTPDLYSARVHVQLDREGDDEREGAMEGLAAAAPFIRKELGKHLHVRRIPELRFEEDRTLEQAMRIERILREVLPPEPAEEGSAGEGPAAPDAEEGGELS